MSINEIFDELIEIIFNNPDLEPKLRILELKQISDEYGYDFNQLCLSASRIVDFKKLNYDNPFDNLELVTELLAQFTKKSNSYVRDLSIPGTNQREVDNDIEKVMRLGLFKQLELLCNVLQYIVALFERGEECLLNVNILNKAKEIDINKLKGIQISMLYNVFYKNIDVDSFDKKTKEFIKFINNNYCVLYSEHPGRIHNSKNNSTMRIYINTPYTLDTLNFVVDYAEECIKAGLDFDMKAFDKGNGAKNNDRWILYSSYDELEQRLKILELLAIKNPKFVASLGSPLPHCACSKNSFYGICHIGVVTSSRDRKKIFGNTSTYNDYVDMLVNFAYLRLLGIYALNKYNDTMSFEEREIIKSYVTCANYISDPSGKDSDKNYIAFGTFNGYSYSQIKNAIKKYMSSYIPDLSINEVYRFKQSIDFLHRTCQGFPLEDKSNIALDTFFTRLEQEKTKKDKLKK